MSVKWEKKEKKCGEKLQKKKKAHIESTRCF